MAPEMLQGKAVSEKVDIYSFGVGLSATSLHQSNAYSRHAVPAELLSAVLACLPFFGVQRIYSQWTWCRLCFGRSALRKGPAGAGTVPSSKRAELHLQLVMLEPCMAAIHIIYPIQLQLPESAYLCWLPAYPCILPPLSQAGVCIRQGS